MALKLVAAGAALAASCRAAGAFTIPVGGVFYADGIAELPGSDIDSAQPRRAGEWCECVHVQARQ